MPSAVEPRASARDDGGAEAPARSAEEGATVATARAVDGLLLPPGLPMFRGNCATRISG